MIPFDSNFSLNNASHDLPVSTLLQEPYFTRYLDAVESEFINNIIQNEPIVTVPNDQDIRKEAEDLAWKHQFVESAKLFCTMSDKGIESLSNALIFKNVVCNCIREATHRDLRFKVSEINKMMAACHVILKAKIFDDDKSAKNLLKHLEMKIDYKKSIGAKLDQEIKIDISNR